MLLLDAPLTEQPQEAVEIDWGNPLASGLAFAQVGASPHNVAGAPASVFGEYAVDVRAEGAGLRFDGTTSQRIVSETTTAASGSGTALAFFFAPSSALAANRAIIGVYRSSDYVQAHYISYENSEGAFAAVSVDNYNWTMAKSSISPTGDRDTILVARFSAGGGRDLWQDGVIVGQNANTRSPAVDRIVVGVYLDFAAPFSPFSGTMYLSCWWNRILTDDEVRAVSANPWQLFRTRHVVLPSSAAPAADVAGAASLALTATGSIAIAKPVSGAVAVALTTAGSIAVAKPVAGNAALALTAAGAIAVAKPVAGAATCSVSATGSIAVAKPVSGAATISATAAGSVAVAKPVAGAATLAVTSTGTLTTVGMGGAATCSLAATGNVAVSKPVSGAATIALTAAGAASVAKPVAGNAALALAAAGSVAVAKPVAGAASLALVAGGSVAIAKPVAGAVVLSLTTTGRIETATLRGLVTAVLTLRSTPTTLTLRPTDATLTTRAGAAALTLRPAADAALQFQTDDPV